MSEFVDFNLSLNLDDVGTWDGTFSMIPQGWYTFTVDNAEQVTTSTGNTGIKFTFKVADEGDQNGKTIRKVYTLKPNSPALARFKHVMIVLGVDPNNISGGDLLGKQLVGEVFHKKMDDRPAADGSVIAGGDAMDLRGERAVGGTATHVEEAPPPPPPVAAKKPPLGGARNGTVAARR